MKRVSAEEATRYWLTQTKGPLDARYYEERWIRGPVAIQNLRTTETDFKGRSMEKHKLLTEIIEQARSEITEGRFPDSQKIKAGPASWPSQTLIVLQDEAGEHFVFDGHSRTFAALWHGVEEMDAYIYLEPGVRELPRNQ